LLPNNYWFFKRLDLNHWNSSLFIEIVGSYSADVLKNATALVLQHHDALRSIRRQEEGQWVQIFQTLSDMAPWWTSVNLSDVPDEQAAHEIEMACDAAQQTLDITRILFRAIYFDIGSDRNAKVFFVIHHLITDGYSTAIFVQDLEQACLQLTQGLNPLFPPKTTSIKATAEFLQAYAQHPHVVDDLQYWRSRSWDKYRALPPEEHVENLMPDTGVAHPNFVVRKLSVEETLLLEQIPRRIGISVEDVLIAALVLAYEKWSDCRSLFLNLVHNGRMFASNEKIDLSRTIGWVSNYANYMFDLTQTNSSLEAVHAVQLQREEIRGKEVYYSLLRFMNENEDVRNEMATLPAHQLEFNFISRWTLASEPETAIAATPLPGLRPNNLPSKSNDGPMRSKFTPFSLAVIHDDGLAVYWRYCQTMYTKKTFEYFIAENMRSIRELIHALSGSDAKSDASISMNAP
jgi:hypothetical protein